MHRRTPRHPKAYISGGHIGRAFINNSEQSARAPIAVSSLCRLDSARLSLPCSILIGPGAHGPRKSDIHILEHRNRDMTRGAPLVITAINPIGHFAGSPTVQRRLAAVCRRAIFHPPITIETAARISNASYPPDGYSSDITSGHLSP